MLVVQPGLEHDRVDRQRAGVVGDHQRGARLGHVRQPAHPDPEPALVEHPGDRHQHAAVELRVEAELVDLGLAVELAARELKDVGQPAPPAAVRRAGPRPACDGPDRPPPAPAVVPAVRPARPGRGTRLTGWPSIVTLVSVSRVAARRMPPAAAGGLLTLSPFRGRRRPGGGMGQPRVSCHAASPAGAVPSLPLGRPGLARRQAPALLRAGLAGARATSCSAAERASSAAACGASSWPFSCGAS